MPSEPTMIRCPHCRLDFTEGGYKAHRESEFSGCDEPEPACVRCGAPVTLLFCDECMDVVGAEIKRGEEIVKDVFPTPPEPACDFDPLAVNANWDDSTDIACKVAAAAMAYARRTPDAVGEARDANADAVSILRRGCAKIDGLPLDKQSPCPEDLALWALTYITRLLAAEAEREEGR